MYPTTLFTPRLELRLADLTDSTQVADLIRTYNDPYIGPWGFYAVGMHSLHDLQEKFRKHGPKPALCTRLEPGTPLPSIIHLAYLRTTGEYIGLLGLSFRNEMPYPDMGYAFLEPFNGKGYASETGREVLRFWREDIGVRDIYVGTFDDNVRSQECARRIGFVDAGPFFLDLGGEQRKRGHALMLPHMTWPKDGVSIKPNVGHAEDRSDTGAGSTGVASAS